MLLQYRRHTANEHVVAVLLAMQILLDRSGKRVEWYIVVITFDRIAVDTKRRLGLVHIALLDATAFHSGTGHCAQDTAIVVLLGLPPKWGSRLRNESVAAFDADDVEFHVGDARSFHVCRFYANVLPSAVCA